MTKMTVETIKVRHNSETHRDIGLYYEDRLEESKLVKSTKNRKREGRRSRKNRIHPAVDSTTNYSIMKSCKKTKDVGGLNSIKDEKANNTSPRPSRRRKNKKSNGKNALTIVPPSTPTTEASSTPISSKTPQGKRGSRDLRSPGAASTPVATDHHPIPDFMTQTDRFGNATTPRSSDAIQMELKSKEAIHVKSSEEQGKSEDKKIIVSDPCESLLDSIRMICCCFSPDESGPCQGAKKSQSHDTDSQSSEDVQDENRVRLLPKHHPDDKGKKCLVLDLDETLVHSSFRAVPNADFVIPVQIEDVVHFVYVAKRPGVDEFLLEMAKHYEIVIYTASLNKYADPLLDLLDPHNVIRTRLFRESCVYYEGNYVKDMSLIDRNLKQAIIIDNSPSSYIFHPENAIDCTSFIDDPNDRELDQIASFLTGIKDVKDVRPLCHQWRDWPRVDISEKKKKESRNQ